MSQVHKYMLLIVAIIAILLMKTSILGVHKQETRWLEKYTGNKRIPYKDKRRNRTKNEQKLYENEYLKYLKKEKWNFFVDEEQRRQAWEDLKIRSEIEANRQKPPSSTVRKEVWGDIYEGQPWYPTLDLNIDVDDYNTKMPVINTCKMGYSDSQLAKQLQDDPRDSLWNNPDRWWNDPNLKKTKMNTDQKAWYNAPMVPSTRRSQRTTAGNVYYAESEED